MNRPLKARLAATACPHDCPSTCALEVELLDDGMIGRVRGAKDNSYTAGVICEKVARYAERLHSPDRLLKPLRRTGPKGSGRFEEISWDAALDAVAEAFLKAEAELGAEAVWPYHYAGTMGLVQRDGIHRLRHAKRYSRQFDTICTNPAWTGYIAGTGKLAGPDPREMALADVVVIWGTNAASTQVNVMTHAMRARKSRGAKVVAVDVYMTQTMKQSDLALLLRPGTDGALACAVMHVLFREGFADREYLAAYTDCPEELEAHLETRTPEWAASITGLEVDEIVAFARLVGENRKTYFRLGYGFSRSRNGAVNMHAAASIACVTGAWRCEGGGAFHNNGAIYRLDKSMIEGTSMLDPTVRALDQSQIGRILTGDVEALQGGPPVTAMLIQNTNPMSVAPEQRLVRRGFERDDLFVCVHEQFMTETAAMADIVLPATQFMEHDDIYKGGGHQHLLLGPKLVDAPGEARENHTVFAGLAERLGLDHPGFWMTPREHIDWMLRSSGYGTVEELEEKRWIDLQPHFRQAHYLDGFAYPDGRFRFRPDWIRVAAPHNGPMGPWRDMPALPDHWAVTEGADAEHPFRLATSPARAFLNSTFNETRTSLAREGRPTVLVSPEDAARLGVEDGMRVRIGNVRGSVVLHAKLFDGVRPGVVVSEGIWPNHAFDEGQGINVLTSADAVAPYGGAAFHDNRVWLRPEPVTAAAAGALEMAD